MFIRPLILLLFLAIPIRPLFAGDPITLKLWDFPRWTKDKESKDAFYWMKGKIAEYEARHPGIKIEFTELSWDRGEEKKNIAILAGNGPDIATGSLPNTVKYIDSSLVEPIDHYLLPEDREEYYEHMIQAYTRKGKVWGWPWYQTGGGIFVNLDLCRERGVVPPPLAPLDDPATPEIKQDWTWEEFLDTTRKLTFDRDGDGVTDVWGFGFYFAPLDNYSWPLLYLDGGTILNAEATEYTMDRAEALSGLQRMVDLVHQHHVANSQCGGFQGQDIWQQFAHQRSLAIMPCGVWGVKGLRKLKTPLDFAVLPFPTGKLGHPLTFIATSGFIVFKQAGEKKRTAAMALARFLTTDQQELSLYGVFPSRKSFANIYDGDPQMKSFPRVFRHGVSVPVHENYEKIDEKVQRALQQLALAGGDPAVWMKGLRPRIEKLLTDTRIQGGQLYRKENLVYYLLFAAPFLLLLILFLLRHRTVALFLLPSLLFFVIFLFLPVIHAVLLAFQNYQIGQGLFDNFVGLRNFATALADPVAWTSLKNTIVYTLVVVPFNVFVALVLASIIYPLGKKTLIFFRAAYYLPGVASVVATSLVWLWLFAVDVGVFNQLLVKLGLGKVHWLTSHGLLSIILTSILKAPGGGIIIYLATLASIPESLLEAARIDGAGPVKSWWHVTVPLLRPTTLFLAITTTISSFQVFGQVLILTNGGPGYDTTVLVYQIYTAAFRDFEFGLSSAMSLALFAVIMAISIAQYRWFRGETEFAS